MLKEIGKTIGYALLGILGFALVTFIFIQPALLFNLISGQKIEGPIDYFPFWFMGVVVEILIYFALLISCSFGKDLYREFEPYFELLLTKCKKSDKIIEPGENYVQFERKRQSNKRTKKRNSRSAR